MSSMAQRTAPRLKSSVGKSFLSGTTTCCPARMVADACGHVHTIRDLGAALQACKKSAQWQLALQLLSQVNSLGQGTAILYTAAIGSCKNNWRHAVQLLCNMKSTAVEADAFCGTALLPLLHWRQAVYLQQNQATGVNIITVNAAMKTCEKTNHWQCALALHQGKFQPDVISFNTAICACEATWCWALQLLCSAGSVNIVTFNSAMRALVTGEQWQRALSLLEIIHFRRLSMTSVTCSTAITACDRGGAFGQFLAEKRPELQTQCKGQPITAITKLASEKFKALSEDDKKVYQEKFVAAKAKYDEDMKAFLEAGGEKKAIKKKGKKDIKKKKDPQAPKKPAGAGGAYGCFLAKNRAAFMKECSGQPVTAVTKLASAKWKELSDEDKKIYEEEFQKKKEEYQEAMKSYVPLSNAEDDEPPVKKRKTKEGAEAKSKESKAAEKADAKAAKAQAKAEAKEAKAKAKAEAKPKGKAKAKAKADASAGVKLEPAVAAKAEKAGWKDVLVKLAALPDVIAAGKSQTAMLQALEKVNGLLHPAKRALLGA
eukprot:s615_g23.t7